MKIDIDAVKLLQLGMTLLGEYRRGRDAVLAAGDPTATDGTLLTDAQLIGLLQEDAADVVSDIDALIAKHSS